MPITDKLLNTLIQQKQDLIRTQDKNEKKFDMYSPQLQELDRRIQERTKQLMKLEEGELNNG